MDIPRNDMRQAMHRPLAKSVVYYIPTEDDFIKEGHSAFIKQVAHSFAVPDINYTITPVVVSYDENTDEFETATRIYRAIK